MDTGRSKNEKSMRPLPEKVSKGTIAVPERLHLLDSTQLHAVLATDADGMPYTSLVSFALTPDRKGLLFLTPKSTRKYKNILKNNYVSLLIDTRANTAKDYLLAEAVTIMGIAKPVRSSTKKTELSEIFISKHPQFKEFILLPEIALICVDITRCIHVTQFQSITIWDARESRAPVKNRP
jgi:heme iron utilization protein